MKQFSPISSYETVYISNVLSSKSENRFLVNFQTKNKMMPSAAIPPETESPTMDPVLRPPLPELLGVFVGEGRVFELVGDSVTKVVMTCPPASVVVVGITTEPGGCVAEEELE